MILQLNAAFRNPSELVERFIYFERQNGERFGLMRENDKQAESMSKNNEQANKAEAKDQYKEGE